ncbi:hypothetical protein L208DRAFT_1384793 [Tricholoma matsutake]|nr:hypothetical protein L208DRAFT_1384793 [Tricholoma matsutake 945]
MSIRAKHPLAQCSDVVLAAGAGLIGEVEIYRGYIRGTVLGNDASGSTTLLYHGNSVLDTDRR